MPSINDDDLDQYMASVGLTPPPAWPSHTYGQANWNTGFPTAASVLAATTKKGGFPTITIGADPEVFLRKGGKMVSAHDILPGSKLEPFKVDGGAIQVDGVAAEFNIEPTTTAAQFSALIPHLLQQVKNHAPGCELQIIPAYEWEKLYFSTLPAETKTLGCDPDYNAWTGRQNDPPDGFGTTLRTASGHIHIGWTEVEDPFDSIHFKECCAIVKQLDFFLGVPSMLWDTDGRRRTLYGKAGAFRVKKYGLEYRTLSNMWLRYPNLYPFIWNAAYYGLHSMLTGKPRFYEEYGDIARKAIDNNDIEFARSAEFKKMYLGTGLQWPKW